MLWNRIDQYKDKVNKIVKTSNENVYVVSEISAEQITFIYSPFHILTFYFYTSYTWIETFTISTKLFAVLVAALSPFPPNNLKDDAGEEKKTMKNSLISLKSPTLSCVHCWS